MNPRPDSAPTWTRALTVRIRADRATVFSLLAEVELWPALFPHIRSARVLKRDGRRKLVAVRARWCRLPLGYRAIVTLDPGQGQVTIRHLSRLTRGSVATWAVRPIIRTSDLGHEVELSVEQQVIVPLPIVGRLLARRFVGGAVARDLGQAMLDRLKEIAEGGSLADRR